MSKIIVKARAERGFRRAGIHFTRAGVEIDTGKLKPEALKAIQEEPNLVVVDPAAPAGSPPAKPPAKKATGKGGK